MWRQEGSWHSRAGLTQLVSSGLMKGNGVYCSQRWWSPHSHANTPTPPPHSSPCTGTHTEGRGHGLGLSCTNRPGAVATTDALNVKFSGKKLGLGVLCSFKVKVDGGAVRCCQIVMAWPGKFSEKQAPKSSHICYSSKRV